MSWYRVLILGVLSFRAFSQPAPTAGDASRSSTLEVQPGKPAIKTSELDRKTIAPWKRFPRFLLSDQKAVWTSPFRTSKQNAKWWGIFGGATAVLIASDKWTSKQLPNTKDQISVAKWTSRIGAAYTLVPVTAGIYFLGGMTHNDHLRETGFLSAEALGNALLVSSVLKSVTQRERPTEGNGRGRFWQGRGRFWNEGASFPSGHAIESWALASVLAHEYSHKKIVPILAYGLAGTICASRFAARKHFASDVVAGSAMGWFIGDYVYGKRHNPAVEHTALGKVLAHVRVGVSLR